MRVFATAAFSFSAAILLTQYLLPDYWQPYAAAALFAVAVVAAFFRFTHKKRALIITFALALGVGFNYGYSAITLAPARALDGGHHTVMAELCEYPERRSYGERASVKVLTDTLPVRTNVYTYSAFPEQLKPGDKISFSADFSLADEIYGEETDYFFSRGCYLSALRAEDFTVKERTTSHRYFYIDLSRAIKAKIREVFPEKEMPFALAVLTGDKSELEDETTYAMQRSGLYHIATVSGMHVSMLAAFIVLLFGNRWYSSLITAPLLILFAAVSGFTPSVLRAVIMQLFILAAPLLKRENDRLTSLSAAMAFILLMNPYAVKSAGLQLSFAATLGIVLFSQRIYAFLSGRFMPRKSRFAKRVLASVYGSFSTSIGALILTYPLSALYFGCISLASPITNLLIVWALSPAFMLICLSVGLGFLFVPAARITAFAASLLIKYIVLISKLLAGSYLASVYLNNVFLIVWFVLAYALFIAFILMRAKPRQLIYPAALTAGALAVVLVLNAFIYDSREGYTVAVLDIGQGQCIVLTSGAYTAVIDCGSTTRYDAGEIAAQYIYGLGRDRVDLLMLTHYHADHANGVKELMGRVKVDAVAVPLPENDESELDEEIIDLTLSGGAELVFVTEDLAVTLGDTAIELYAPMGTSDENERGVCMLVTNDGFDTLITGDIDSQLEKMLIGANDLPDIELLVVGHHGSRYSTSRELLETVAPEIGVISVGYNTYGHPSEEVLARLMESGAAVYRTDELGNIIIKSKGR